MFQITNSPSFDYFARVKKSLQEAPAEKLYVSFKSEETEDEEEDYYKVLKAPMMQLLPGSRPADGTPTKKLSDAVSSTASTKEETEGEESEYTYEDEDEDDEDIIDEAAINNLANDIMEHDSYEARAEEILEGARERVSIAPDLEYIDEEDEDIQPQVNNSSIKPIILGY